MQRHWGWSVVVGIGLLAGCVPVSAPAPEASMPVSALPTAVSDAAVKPAGLETRTVSVSPDGQWRAESVVAFPAERDEYYQQLTVTRADGGIRWTPVERWSRMGLGYTVAVPFAWSTQDDALYFTNQPTPDGCALFVNAWGLLRLDLTNGEVRELLPGNGLSLALSPGEDQVAEIVYTPLDVVIHDLESGTARTLALTTVDATTQAGSLVWSPDSAQVALALAHDACVGGWARATSVLVIDVATSDTTTLLAEDERLLKPVAWPATNTLILEGEGGNRFALNPETGEIAPAQ